jgi:hypothetical protein
LTEKSEAARDGAILQKNSGRGKHAKGDAILGPFLLDYKEYTRSYSLSIKSWSKICTDALTAGGLIPALKVILTDGDNKARVWIVPEYVIHEYIELKNRDTIDLQE